MTSDFALDSKILLKGKCISDGKDEWWCDKCETHDNPMFVCEMINEITKDVAQKIQEAKKELEQDIDEAQENFANLNYLEKVHAMDIIDKIFLKHFGTLAGDEK